MSFKEIKLPSGATLKVAPAPFAKSKALYAALCEELKGVSLQSRAEIGDVIKNVFCFGFSSPKVDAALWACMAHCLYDDGKVQLKIDADTFEPAERRQDFVFTCIEVAQENIGPFGTSLMQLYSQVMAAFERKNTPASRPETNPS